MTVGVKGEKVGSEKDMFMVLKNVLIVVKDIEKSKQFYKELFGLEVVLDNEGNVILTEGLVLQDERIWKHSLKKETIWYNNSFELYFEERNIEGFVEKLEHLYPSIKYADKISANCCGKRVIRFYDLDGNLIEVGTPI